MDRQKMDKPLEDTIQQLEVELSQLRKVEARLRRSEFSLKKAERIAKLGHWEFNISTEELHWSDEIYRIFGVDPHKSQASYELFQETLHPDDRDQVTKAYRHSLASKTPYDIVHRLQLAHGEIKYVHEVCQTTYDQDGAPLVSMGTVQDVTDKILHDELIQQKSKLDSLGVLAGGIAHDFNNTLVGILGNLDIVLDGLSSNDTNYDLIQKSKDSALKARAFSQQLLTFAKGGSPLCEPTDFAHMLRETVDFFTSGTRVKVNFDIPEDLWLANIDSGQMSQVFQNLAINAIEAMPEGGEIKITLVNRKAGDSVIFQDAGITVRFQDSGPGIKDEDVSSIFDPYFTSKVGGHGLGLAIVDSIIAKHGGQIYLDREMENSSLFVINIPVSDIREPLATFVPQNTTTNQRILVLDDDLVVLEVFQAMLEKIGYTVDLVADCEEALVTFESRLNSVQPYDLVITDLTMPGDLDGLEILRRIRKMSSTTKVLLTSGYSENEMVKNHEDFGFKGVLVKPFGFDELKAALVQLSL